ncbi:hypothetical protein EZV62_027005 [Acer yangbiense]|uniref:non-specific serine/threonine protein kinase n=1 Tax=Acer yangbiense TaxID=1000413 RepID=A0A5C7GSH8_9ROSI|nr:hypothetical protein EZV62_027005 [Acer yangbiense]
MLMMMHMNQQMSLVLLLSFLSFRQLTFAQLQLHPNEDVVVRQIAAKLGAKLTNFTVNPCQSRKLPIITDKTIINIINCSYTEGNYSHITNLQLQKASLQGRLPPELANLTFLEEIDLTRNYLSGELPKEWTSMRHLNTISLTANRLSGKIPKEWGNFANLTELALSSNQFVGSLPITLAKLTNMIHFRISDNSFNGIVPEFIRGWTKLQRLEMYSSGLKGPIDATIFALENLTDLRITDMSGPSFDFPKLITKDMNVLILRNLNMSGSIPTDIRERGTPNTLDLTFNKLAGEINSIDPEGNYIFLSGNMFTGTIPESFLSAMIFPIITLHRQLVVLIADYNSFHINCGGLDDVTINHTVYERDGGAVNGASFQYDSGTNWGFISAGDFMDDNGMNDNGYVVKANPDTQHKLYSEARASPLFLTYYGYCLENGNYTVNLHFAEILFRDEEPYNKVGRRIFNIYIQGILTWKDFNIKEQANGTGKAIIKTFNATVTENTLEIRLYWAGKGTTCIPSRGICGPLISAISICQGKSLFLHDFDHTSLVSSYVILTRHFNFSGYMAPEYALWGHLTEKADVYSFGVVALEIAGGRNNASHRAKNDRVCLLDLAFNLQQKGNLMEIVDPILEDKFDKEEAEKMIRVALLCSNADPALRPTMSEVVSMLESQTIVQEVASDPGIYGADLQIKQLKGYYQQMQDQSSSGSSAPNFASERTRIGSSTTSAHDLYTVNSESIYSINKSAQDLYSVNSESIYSNLPSVHDSESVHLNSSEMS